MCVLGTKKLMKMYPDLDDEQYQQGGIDLKIGAFFKPSVIEKYTLKRGLYNNEKINNELIEHKSSSFILEPFKSVLVETKEKIKIHEGYQQHYYLRSTLLRNFIIGGFAIGDSGFNGNLMFLLMNTGVNDYRLDIGERFAQMEVTKLDGVHSNYMGDYQDERSVLGNYIEEVD